MKFKGLSKIAIAGAALAATAATLGTSTYAWYVSNQEAKATGVVAQMQDSTGGSIYISKDGSKFQASVQFDDSDFQEGNEPGNVNGELFPITTEDAVNFVTDEKVEPVTDPVSYVAAPGNRIVVTAWIKSDSDVTVQPKLGVANTSTADAVKQTLYSTVNNTYTAGKTLAVDAVEALRMAVFKDDATTGTIYDVKSIAKEPVNFGAYTTPSGFANATQVAVTGREDSLGAAHGYYKDVTGEAPNHVTPTTATTSWGTISLTANTAVKLKFVFWLEGADTECFDSCAGQEIEFTFDFALAA